MMHTLSELCDTFFDGLDLVSGSARSESADDKMCFEKAMQAFLKSGEKEDAFVVYLCFCEIFNIFGQGYTNTKKLLEMLSDHEYHSGELLAKHRDHYAHSVYVFALGLAIYAHDGTFRKAFRDFYGYDNDTGNAYCFLKFWGLVSLFHDIGYPFELAHAQIRTYCEEIWGKDDKNLYVSYGNLQRFISLDPDVGERLRNAFPDGNFFGTIDDLLAYGLKVRLGYDREAVKHKLEERVLFQKNFMDHAYFSAVLLAKKLFSVPDFGMTAQYLDTLTAILLHNSFNKYEAPGRRPISLSEHPLSYLLILCDELQSWDRSAYGKISKRDPIAWDVRLNIADGKIKIRYIFDSFVNRAYSDDTAHARIVYNKNYVEMAEGEFVAKLFGTEYRPKYAPCATPVDPQKYHEGYLVPSTELILETEEEKKEKKESLIASDKSFLHLYDLAKAIHASYHEHCKGYEGARLDEDFGLLPLEYKISNIATARSYAGKLAQIDCFYSSRDLDCPVVTDIDHLIYSSYKDDREFLCREEHVRWVQEKLAMGWKYGTDYSSVEERDRKKIHKCIVPYELLSDEEKSKDALMIDGIFTQLLKPGSNIKIYNYPMGHKPKLEIAGVGHRFFTTDAESLKREIKACLQKYSETHRVVVRTCFGYGADWLIVECALELGLTVKADIPLDYESYIEDVKNDMIVNGYRFTDGDELKMRHLLAQAAVCKVIPDPIFKYAAASKYIVEKCDVLIALWDGKPMALFDENKRPINRGGTYDSICLARKAGKAICVVPCER